MTVYYVDGANGSNINSGMSIDSAWKSVDKVNAFNLQPGDVVEFVGDGNVYNGTLKPNESGTANAPIVFKKYSGSDEAPIFNGYNEINTSWTPDQGAHFTNVEEAPLVVFVDNQQLVQADGLDQLDNGQWYYADGRLHVQLEDGVNPNDLGVEWANGSNDYASITSNYQSHIRFEDLHAKTVFNGATTTGRAIVVQRGSDVEVIGNEASSDKDGPAIGIMVYNSPDATVVQNSIHHQWVGIYIEGSGDAGFAGLVSGNTITDLIYGTPSNNEGIKIATNSDFTGLVIEGNDISGFQQDGIDAYTGHNLTIRNNYIHDSGTRNADHDINGIKVGPLGTGSVVSGNTIENVGLGTAKGSAITISSHSVIDNNTIINPNIYGINVVKNAQNVVVTNNTVTEASVAMYVQTGAEVEASHNTLDGSKPWVIPIALPHDMTIEGGIVVGDYNHFINDGVPQVVSGGTYVGGEHDNADAGTVNTAPVAQDIALSATDSSAPVTIAFAGDDVDTDDDHSTLSYVITAQPGEGSVVNNHNGTLSFDPGDAFRDLAEGQTRDIDFTYTATDSHGAVSNTGTVTVTVSGTDEIIWGDDGKNTIRAGDGRDDVRGLGGSDRLYGGAGKDTLDGGAGKDRLYGGDDGSVDVLNGGAFDRANDKLFGTENEKDIFVFSAKAPVNDGVDGVRVTGWGRDAVFGFDAELDVIDLTDAHDVDAASLKLLQRSWGVLIKVQSDSDGHHHGEAGRIKLIDSDLSVDEVEAHFSDLFIFS